MGLRFKSNHIPVNPVGGASAADAPLWQSNTPALPISLDFIIGLLSVVFLHVFWALGILLYSAAQPVSPVMRSPSAPKIVPSSK